MRKQKGDSRLYLLIENVQGENVERRRKKHRECLVLIDIDKDCNECGEGMAPQSSVVVMQGDSVFVLITP